MVRIRHADLVREIEMRRLITRIDNTKKRKEEEARTGAGEATETASAHGK